MVVEEKMLGMPGVSDEQVSWAADALRLHNHPTPHATYTPDTLAHTVSAREDTKTEEKEKREQQCTHFIRLRKINTIQP